MASRQGLPHEMPLGASGDYRRTGWDSRLEIDGSELYEYSADFGRLVIIIREDLYDEPDEDYAEDDPQRYQIDKRLSYWHAECRYYGEPELFSLGDSAWQDPGDRRRQANIAFKYGDVVESADAALLQILQRAPQEWLHDAYTYPGRIWQGWTQSYQNMAGRVPPPILL